MRIAICISGFIRTWEFTKNSFKNLLCKDKKHEIDIFIHTYYQNYFECSSGLKDIIYTQEEIYKMFEGFNVKIILIENRNSKMGRIFFTIFICLKTLFRPLLLN